MNTKRVLLDLLPTQLVAHCRRYSVGQVSTRCSYSVYKDLRSRLGLQIPCRQARLGLRIPCRPGLQIPCRHAHAQTAVVQPVLKPLETLQKHSTAPLLAREDLVFDPTEEEIRAAQMLFLPDMNHKIEFLKSAVFTEHLPEYDLPEVAFIGRSNVGKSSLIQILLSGVKDLEVKISKTPGHTKTLNFFQVGEKMSIVDMPGYGYRMPDHYVESVENFLRSRQKLCRTFFLVDSEVGVGKADIIGLHMLEEFQIPYAVVMTKIDKAKPSRLIKNFMSVLKRRNETTYCFPQPFLVSSINGDGIALLQSFIAYVSGNFKPKGL